MGRREKEQARQQAEQVFQTQQQYTAEERGFRQAGREAVMPAAQALVGDTGYSRQLKEMAGRVTGAEGLSPEEQSAVTQETTGVASSAFGKAREGLARRAARTRNTAGMAGAIGELGREEAKQQASTARQNRLAFADIKRQRQVQNLGIATGIEDEAQRRREQGINLLSRLYGIDTGAFTAGRSQPGQAAGLYGELAFKESPWFGVVESALSGAGQAAGGYLASRRG